MVPAAYAHTGTSTEPLGFVDGFMHPLIIPGHILVILASAMLAGQQGFKALGQSALVFALSFVLGLAASSYFTPPREIALVFIILTVLCGALVVVSIMLPRYVYLPLIALAAGLVGLDTDFVSDGNSLILTNAGALMSSTLVFIYLDILVAKIYEDWPAWMEIGVRTVGSWIVAVSLLTFALVFSS